MVLQSKWGGYGLYEHRGDQSPYIADGADRLEYYRRTNHTHSFDDVAIISYLQPSPVSEDLLQILHPLP